MQIICLQLENVKSYAKAKIAFTDGTNAIVGQNGAGKSTILEAIGFALFDAMGYRQSDFVREGAKTATVTVTIRSALDERAYEVTRRCGASSQYYVYDPDLGARLCEGKTDVLAFLKEHMGVDPAADLSTLFTDAVGVPQGMLTAAFLQSPAVRKSVFDTLLQVNEYKEASERLLEPQRTLQQRLQELNLQLTELETRLERLPELESAVAARAKQIRSVQGDLEMVQQRLQSVQKERGELDAIRSEMGALQNQHAQGQTRLQSLQQQIVTAQKTLQTAQEARQIVAENEPAYAAYLEAQQQQVALRAQERELQQLQAQYNTLDRSLLTARTDLERQLALLQEIAEAQTTVQQLRSAVQQQTELEQELTQLQQLAARLEDGERNYAEQRNNLQQLMARREALQQERAAADTLAAERQQAEQALAELRESIGLLQQERAGYRTTADALKRQNETLNAVDTANCPVCEQPLTEEHRTEMLTRNEQRLQELRALYKQTGAAITEQQEREKRLQADVRTLEQKIQQVPRQAELDNVVSEIARAQRELDTLQTQLETWKSAASRLPEVERALQALGNPAQRSAIAADMAARHPQVEAETTRLRDEIAVQESTLKELESQMRAYDDLEASMAQTTAQMTQSEPGYQAVLAHRNLAETVEQHAELVDVLTREHAHLAAEQEKVAADIAEIEQRFNSDQYQELVDCEQQLRTQVGRFEAELSLLQREQAGDEEALKKLRMQHKALVQQQADKQRIERQAEVIETIRSILRQSGPYITRALIRRVSAGAAQIFSELTQDYSRHLAWNEDYGITLEIDGRERQFVQLSGGEQMSAALSVRLALLREMSNINIAFFDEPTTNLDETRRESLARQILEIRGFQQLFVISHDDTFEQATQNIVRVQQVGGASRAESVE